MEKCSKCGCIRTYLTEYWYDTPGAYGDKEDSKPHCICKCGGYWIPKEK